MLLKCIGKCSVPFLKLGMSLIRYFIAVTSANPVTTGPL